MGNDIVIKDCQMGTNNEICDSSTANLVEQMQNYGKEVKQADSSVNTISLPVNGEGMLSDSFKISSEGETTENPVNEVTEIARSPTDMDSTDLKLIEQANSSKPATTEDEEKQKKKDEKKRKKRKKGGGEKKKKKKKKKK